MSDSINTYKNKVGDLYKEKDSYILEIDNLKKINENLYKEVKNLKDNPIVITEVITEFKFDTIMIDNSSKIDTLNNVIKRNTTNNIRVIVPETKNTENKNE